MDAMNYTQVRKNFSKAMNHVCSDHEPLIITRQKAPPVVMLSLEDYNAMKETFYLLQSPENAKCLEQSLKEAESGKLQKRDLEDLEG